MNDKELEMEIDAVLKAAGLDLLEFAIIRHKDKTRVKAVVYRKEGTGTEECAKAYRLMLPRVQAGLSIHDPYIEVYSPGIDRIIRTQREWKAFVGRRVKVLLVDSSDWIDGLLKDYHEGMIVLNVQGKETNIPENAILKARLDSLHEGDKAHGI